ncbi:MAG TPA: carboxymuconolactone decarboxylase family protein [Anaeromyxobacteraceae bacterium]|nr:carboxymuconolactone decarboxylase family protein [Anaeromyxobacteraceae bacterium]
MPLPKDIETAYDAYASTVYGSKILEKKYVELLAYSNSVMAECLPCIKLHAAEAKKHGATDSEIALAYAIAMTVSAGKHRLKAKELLEY